MNLLPFFKSVLQQDLEPIVICNLKHTIIFMNHSAKLAYPKIQSGDNIFNCHSKDSRHKIMNVVWWFSQQKNNNIIHTYYNQQSNKDIYMIALRDNDNSLIGYYEKHVSRTPDATPFYHYPTEGESSL